MERHIETDAALGVLLHEYSHALAWGMDVDDHGEWFEAARGKVFEAYLHWLKGEA